MDSANTLLVAVGERAWPVAAIAAIVLFFRTRLVKAVCWNLVLRALSVPIRERRSIITQVARVDLDVLRPRMRKEHVVAVQGVRGKGKMSSKRCRRGVTRRRARRSGAR